MALRQVTVSITYDMPDDTKSLENELDGWLKGRITVPDVVHGEYALHYMRTKAWSTDGSIISIKGGMSFLEKKWLSVEEVRRLAAENWSGNWWW